MYLVTVSFTPVYDKKKRSTDKKSPKMYSLLFNSNGGGPALAPWPCAVHIRPMRVVTGVAGAALTEVDGFLMIAVGGLMPVGFGKRDDAVDTLLVIDLSDGVGDGALWAPPSDDASGFVSLIFFSLNQFVLFFQIFFSFTFVIKFTSRNLIISKIKSHFLKYFDKQTLFYTAPKNIPLNL